MNEKHDNSGTQVELVFATKESTSNNNNNEEPPTVTCSDQPTLSTTTTTATTGENNMPPSTSNDTTDVTITEEDITVPEAGSLQDVVKVQDAYIRAILAKLRMMEKELTKEKRHSAEMQDVHHMWHLQELYDMYRVMGIDSEGPLEQEEEMARAGATQANAQGEANDQLSTSHAAPGVSNQDLSISTMNNLRCRKCHTRFHSITGFQFHMIYSLLHDRRNVSNWKFCNRCQQYYPWITRQRHEHCAIVKATDPRHATNTEKSNIAAISSSPSSSSSMSGSVTISSSSTTSTTSHSPSPRKRRRTGSISSTDSSTATSHKYECTKCDQVFKSHTALSSHLRFSLQHDPENINNWNYCSLCDKKYHPRVGTRHKQCRLQLQKMEEENKLKQQKRLELLEEQEVLAIQQLNALHSRRDHTPPLKDEHEVATPEEESAMTTFNNTG